MTVICVVYLFVDEWFLICKIEINRYFCISVIFYTLCYGININHSFIHSFVLS